ncbi:MAG: DUF6702 family protein [Cyanobacteria bacterium P01_G01_bin.49]
MEFKREFFPTVQKTVMPRPYFVPENDVLGQSGTAWAADATVYGTNWYLNREQGLIEIYEAGPAISFYHLIPRKDKYEKEGLYLRLKLAYRTTEEANVNIRNFSGNHVTLPNSVAGHIYDDPGTYWWVTDDLTRLGDPRGELGPETRARLLLYAETHFKLLSDGEPLSLEPVGAQIEGDYLWVYQERRVAGPPAHLTVRCTLMHELFAQQRNQVNLRVGDLVRTLHLAPDQPVGELRVRAAD